MALPHKIAAVLFDMDGTLVDSDAAVDRAWTIWAREYGVDPDHLLAIAPGVPSEDTVRKVLADRGEKTIAEATARIRAMECDDVTDVAAAEGAHAVLDRLQELGIPWAVVTGADTRLAKARLNAARITAPILLTTDDVAHGKPDPEGYLRAAELLGVPAHGCLVVEDTEPGAAAGRAAGARVATLKGVAGDLPISGLPELLSVLEDGCIPGAASADPTA